MNFAEAFFIRDKGGRRPLQTCICYNQEESKKIDVFPYVLNSPIVLVERQEQRGWIGQERWIEKLVSQFSGQFAGT